MSTTTKFETGAKTHAVNDLILFTDNTFSVYQAKIEMFNNIKAGLYNTNKIKNLIGIATKQYIKEFPSFEDHAHILGMSRLEHEDYFRYFQNQYNDMDWQ